MRLSISHAHSTGGLLGFHKAQVAVVLYFSIGVPQFLAYSASELSGLFDIGTYGRLGVLRSLTSPLAHKLLAATPTL